MRKWGKRRKYTVTIGISGADNKVGTTHLAIMLANYLASKERYKVAVVDMSASASLAVLREIYEGNEDCEKTTIPTTGSFHVHEVDYYSCVRQKDIANVLQLGYEYVIMDFGRYDMPGLYYELLRCHMKILLGSCCEWQQKKFEQAIMLQKESKLAGNWNYAAFFGIDSVKKEIEKKFRIQVHKVPYEEDPFRLHRTHFEPLNNMLQEALECL